MTLRDWFSRGTPLQLALERGLLPGADLGSEIHKLGDFRIKSTTDAKAVCVALEQQIELPILDEWRSPVYHLIALFQRVEDPDCDAFETFAQLGLPLLCRIVELALADPETVHQDCALLALKMLALYQTAEGTDAVLAAARKQAAFSGSLSVVSHPQRLRPRASRSRSPVRYAARRSAVWFFGDCPARLRQWRAHERRR